MGSAGKGTGDWHEASDGMGSEEKAQGTLSGDCVRPVLSGPQAAFGSGNDLESREMVR